MKESAAVILGMGLTSLALVRALGRKGVPVFGIGLNKYEVALFSTYCRSLGAIDPRYESERLLEFLIEFGYQRSKDRKLLLYPTGDECVVFIGEHHKELSQYYHFSKLNPEIVELFLNKGRFYQACLEYHLPRPLSFLPISLGELKDIEKDLTFPCIVKPKYSYKWAMKHGLTKGIVCSNPNELLTFGKQVGSDISNFIVQEIIDGPETDIYVFAAYFDRQSQPHGIFTGNKIRQFPVEFGTATMLKTAHKPDLERMSIDVLQKIGYQGLCDAEYKYDKRSNTYKILEINPRICRWYGIVNSAGHETIYYSYLDLTDQPIPDVSVKSKNLIWVFASRDFPAMIKNKNWNLKRIIESYMGPRTWCIWAKDDIKPFFAYFGEIVVKELNFLRRRKHHE